jgi:hypothetical protein
MFLMMLFWRIKRNKHKVLMWHFAVCRLETCRSYESNDHSEKHEEGSFKSKD